MLRRFIDWWRGPAPVPRTPAAPTRQAGAVPYRVTDKGVSVLLVTSRRTGRWVFPKGGLMSGRTPWESAAQEALEEAGVEGEVEDVALGAYPSVRIRGDRREDLEVSLYLLRVTRQLDRWPERGQRRRRWMSLSEAAVRLGDPGLVDLLNRAAERLEALAAPVKAAKGRRKIKAASGR
ncbi:NUDIX hydrolase [Phenylobacterium sp.]|uniref:NUDIX hydrolase n=1 Tax=Phenylobacterium sp. TaxID=1871053 RepID=UPI002730ED73|nr:NUDIX hydrolase [Phenylobacterium sp.]MDP2213364.1 NUDIX hydrolase [Phenylobacterium sp.]